MAVRNSNESVLHRISIPGGYSVIPTVIRDILNAIKDLGYSEEAVFGINLALEEALANAIKHGNKKDPTKRIHICYQVTDAQTFISVQDEGPGFRPESVPDPTIEENLEKPCGRGIMLMRAFMNEVTFNKAGNEVRLVKVNEL